MTTYIENVQKEFEKFPGDFPASVAASAAWAKTERSVPDRVGVGILCKAQIGSSHTIVLVPKDALHSFVSNLLKDPSVLRVILNTKNVNLPDGWMV